MGCCNVVARLSMADMVCLDSMQKKCAVLEQCWVCMLEFKLCCEILLLLNMVVFYVYKTGVSKAEYLVHQCIWNRLSACGEFCSVHSWQNGTRCKDGVKVLWCHSHLVWLVFEASIPTCTRFPSENFL